MCDRESPSGPYDSQPVPGLEITTPSRYAEPDVDSSLGDGGTAAGGDTNSDVYWSMFAGGGDGIGRADLDGTNRDLNFVRGTSPAYGVAITPKVVPAGRH